MPSHTHLDEDECLHCRLTKTVEDYLATHPRYGHDAMMDLCRLIGDMLAYSAYKHPDTREMIEAACENVSIYVEQFTRETLRQWLEHPPRTSH